VLLNKQRVNTVVTGANYDSSPQFGLASVYKIIKKQELHPIHYYIPVQNMKPLIKLGEINHAFCFKVSPK
jgi:hypothetical protein